MEPRCVKRLDGNYVLTDVTPERVNRYVRTHCREYYYVRPGEVEFRGVALPLEAPMLVGFRPRKGTILLPCTKVCAGTMLLEIDAGDDGFEFFRSRAREYPANVAHDQGE